MFPIFSYWAIRYIPRGKMEVQLAWRVQDIVPFEDSYTNKALTFVMKPAQFSKYVLCQLMKLCNVFIVYIAQKNVANSMIWNSL